jgi:hypothetical protein
VRIGHRPEAGEGASAVDLVEVVTLQTLNPRTLVNSSPLNPAPNPYKPQTSWEGIQTRGPGEGFHCRHLGQSGFARIAARHLRRQREDLGLRFGVLVLVLELGFGVYISELGFRWFVFWESWAHVWESHCEGVCFWRSGLGMSIGVWGEGFRILGLEFGLEFFVVGFRVQG